MTRHIIFVCAVLLTASVLLAQETPNTPNNVAASNIDIPLGGNSGLPAWDNTVGSIHVIINGQEETVRAYQNSMPTGQQGNPSFLYNYLPSLRTYEFNPQSKFLRFDVVLNALHDEDRTKLQGEIKQSGATLTPLAISAYSIGLKIDKQVVQIDSGEKYDRQTIPVRAEIKDPYILNMLETDPDSVIVDITLYNKFQVINIESVSGVLTTALKDNALETVLGNKPQEGAVLFVSKDIQQEIKSNLINKIELQLPPNPSPQLTQYLEKLKQLFEVDPATEEELKSATDDNIFYRSEQFRKDVSPAFVKGLIKSVNDSGSFRNVLEKAWDELNELKNTHKTAEAFHQELRRKEGGGSGGFDYNLFTLGGRARFSNKEWSQMTDTERSEFTDFYNKRGWHR